MYENGKWITAPCMIWRYEKWDDIKANCDKDFTNKDYDAFYGFMTKWIV